MSEGAAPGLSAIVPATNAPASLERCVTALQRSLGPDDELIVITEPAGDGPASARNAGAARAAREVLVFVDSDVEVHPDALERIRSRFAADRGLGAAFGSYDAEPEAPDAVSGFRNLLHHRVHQQAAGPAETFWAGLGAVRREAFLQTGGFDAARFPSPQIEDVELGVRLAADGVRIECDPEIQGKHLKRWSVASMVRTDFSGRGVPWVALMLRSGAPRDALNLGWRHRLSAAACALGVGALIARRARLAALSLLALIGLNAGFYVLLARRRGVLHAVAGVGLHALHHLTSVAAVPAGVVAHLRRRL
jgi:GT2 family glycosyltransferase